MNRMQLINHLLAQAHSQRQAWEETTRLLDALLRAEALEAMAEEWMVAHPPKSPLQVMRVDSLAVH